MYMLVQVNGILAGDDVLERGAGLSRLQTIMVNSCAGMIVRACLFFGFCAGLAGIFCERARLRAKLYAPLDSSEASLDGDDRTPEANRIAEVSGVWCLSVPRNKMK